MTEEEKNLINLKEIVNFKWVLISLLEENEKLEKQFKKWKKLLNKFKIQQKDFIKYLEDEMKLEIQRENINCETTNKRYILEEILQKYKEIIGSDK